MNRKALPFALVLLLLTGSCTVKFAYNYADWMANWAIDDYIDLDRQQKAFFKERFKALHSWHRQTQLPSYVTYLQQLQTALAANTVNAEQLYQQSLQAQTLLSNSKPQLLPPLAELLASLSPQQIDGLLKNLQENNREEDTQRTADDERKERQESMMASAKRWLGRLTTEQKERIHLWSQQLEPRPEGSTEEESVWEEELTAALTSGEQKQITAFLDRYLLADTQPEEHLAEDQRPTWELFAGLLNSRTDKQRRHLTKKLQNLADDFAQLASKAKPSKPSRTNLSRSSS